jgi:hypothetical protein
LQVTSVAVHSIVVSATCGGCGVGDISYAMGFVTSWDTFFEQIEALASSMAYMTCIGNHERDWCDARTGLARRKHSETGRPP